MSAHLLSGSLIATRKSCACSAMGEKPSRMMCPSFGLIQSGREAWSFLRCSHEKSWSVKMCDISRSCWRRCASSVDKFPMSFSLERSATSRSSASLRRKAVKLIVAPLGMSDDSAGEPGESGIVGSCNSSSTSTLSSVRALLEELGPATNTTNEMLNNNSTH